MSNGLGLIDTAVVLVYGLIMLMISRGFMGRQKTLKEYLVASGNVPWWAVGMSILATLFSTISLTGGVAEFFEYGFQGTGIWWIASILSGIIISMVFIPVFLRTGIMTAYEYLERRFSMPIRVISGLFFLMGRGLYLGVVLYSSGIVLSAAFGNSVDMIMLIIAAGLFSGLFSLMGGARAVIWTDTIQMGVIYIGITWLLIAVIGKVDGGISGIWQIATENGKDFSYLKDEGYFSWSLYTKTAFWPLLVGLFFNAMAQKGSDQLTVQRYLSSPSAKAASKAMWVGVLGSIPIGTLMMFVGLGLYAFYQQYPDYIDLGTTGVNGVFPHYLINELPMGLAGLLVAVLVAAITSTVNSGIQCLATVTLTDFQMRFSHKPLTEKRKVLWGRIWTITWSFISIGLAIFISATASENISRVSVAVFGLFAGPSLGIFLLGMLTRRANAWGAGIGALSGAAVTIWVNYFLKSSTGESVCFAWPIVFGVATTCIGGYALSYLFPAPRSEQVNGLVVYDLLGKEAALKAEALKDAEPPPAT
ncbi:sodium/solute symporter [Coraliomargarita sp. SDUM461004]|uniref:Sodium/solute symporter n=1 Tax=Thalassobacterium sedimentorum TaxID=3041258 RepID=A0ABU1AMW0_9BACT|nr:sodium/solute symporter [Coraliomargarita sp. SDUM461004]MDQ8196138.1 sodium/solute symporter [Coraliomargarita sp. SDUM461004]